MWGRYVLHTETPRIDVLGLTVTHANTFTTEALA